jgi:CarboxypepD_reg-like domain/TonB-dependent Receptor Plug Domain
MLRLLLFGGLALTSAAWSQTPGEVRGSVVDARGGEALAKVEILLGGGAYRTTTDATGHFVLKPVTPGDYVLNISTVGYHLIKKPFHLDAGETKDFEVVLSPDTFHQTDTVEAKADPFDAARADSQGALVLAGNDAKNLASVLADDPLRAVQSLPGVSSNNDFDARFSLRGADFSRIGLYVDGVLLHEPFHMIQGQNLSGTGSTFDGDMVDEMELHEGAMPSRFGDRSAGVLDVTTRDGSRTANTFRLAASVSVAGLVGEGPLGKKKRGSWLAVVRKSYLQYIVARTFPDTTLIFGLEDAQTRLTYDLTPKNNITLYVLESFSNLNRASVGTNLGINSIVTAGYHYTLVNVGWRYSPAERLLIVNHFAWMREKFDDQNPNKLPTSGGFYGEWVWNGAATWMWNARNPLEGGWSVRQLRDQGFADQYQSVQTAPRLLDHFNGNALLSGGYLQQSWSAFSGRIRFTAGARIDHHSLDTVTAVSPSASAAFGVTTSTSLQLAWGEYVQYPEISLLTSPLGSRSLLPSRSNHAQVAVEQRLGKRTRLRAEYYDRSDRDLVFQPLYDPRILPNAKVFAPPVNPPYVNSLRGYARGLEVFLQHSSANRLTGWVSYAFGRTAMRDGVTAARFPSDYEQRHTVNVYGGYRLRPSVNLSMKWSYGTGFPLPGYLRQSGTTYFLANSRNQLRLSPYSRVDFRVNKAWTHDKWKLTLYGELINLTNRTNYVFESFDGYNSSSKQAFLTLDKLFPILPSAGLVFER